MGLFSTPIRTLDDLFVHTLQDIYYVERQIVKNLPTMIGATSDSGLREALRAHLLETEGHVARVEQVFEMHGRNPDATRCPAIDGIVSEAEEIMSDCEDREVCDAAILSAAQAVEHYEITRYGTLVAFARQLGREDCASVLAQNLEEEKAADAKLTGIAEGRVNRRAA
jgi:ferritin-like metal-binding protein YciE